MVDRPTAGLALALELTDLGVRLREQRYRREHPGATDDAVARFLAGWMAQRPGAPHGDSAGRPGPRFE